MEKTNIFKLFLRYLKDKSFLIFSYIFFTLIFTCVLYLYEVPLFPILYCVLITLFFNLIFFFYGFSKYVAMHENLTKLKNEIFYTIRDLPLKDDLITRDFCDIITKEFKEISKIRTTNEKERDRIFNFYTLWAHQIKTPISAMKLILESKSQKAGYEKELLIELFKTQQYVNMVLSYLKLGNDSSDFVFKKINLDDAIKKAVKNYSKLFILKKISLELKEINTVVVTDEKWLIFVIEQILSNSLKYTNKGYIKIYVKNSSLYIEDSGIGINKEDLPRIFEEGFTGYNGQSYRKATGIGLSLCKKILTNLACNIEITSNINVGTKVKITFNQQIAN